MTTLSAEVAKARDGKLTASRVRPLMVGTPSEINDLFREMVGDPTFEPKDLSGAWPVQLGIASEQLNLDWYERKEGRTVSRRGEVVICPRADWAAATLDGWDATIPAPVEAKHVGGREDLSVVIDRYQPQLHWQMIVTETTQAILSVIEGAKEPIIERIPLDQEYAGELWRRAEAFMRCVWSLTPPIAADPITAPVQAKHIVDMAGSNSWAASAADWLANIAGKRAAEMAEKTLKALVPDDAAQCFGHGVRINRDRAGRLSLKELVT